MTHPNPSTALASVVIDELVVRGLRFIAISPGSRSAALAIAAALHPDVQTRVIIDERSAAFHALGVSLASGAPAAALATSGTAPANFFPAVVEADMAGVRLVTITADRPAELRGVGANQTIDQVELFGAKVRDYRGIEAPDGTEDSNDEWRETVAGLIDRATGPFPGPVHLNVAFREPTVPVADDGRTGGQAYVFPTPRNGPRPGIDPVTDELFGLELDAHRGLVVAGDGDYDRHGLLDQARRLGWPVLATALSGLRGEEVVNAYHYLLEAGVPKAMTPSTVIAVGAIGPDPILEDLVVSSDVRIRVDRWGRHIDPRRNATRVVAADPIDVLAGVVGVADESWARSWLENDRVMRGKVELTLQDEVSLSGAVVGTLLNEIDRGALVVSSSLPIREIDAHLTSRGAVFANRGASGIDGFVSTALGVATIFPRTLALCGDLSLLHDSNGFLHDGEVDLTLVVIDNGGGGLFDSLPPARHAPEFERLFITPPGRDLSQLVKVHGARVQTVQSPAELIEAVSSGLSLTGIDVVLVPVDRSHDLSVRSRSYL